MMRLARTRHSGGGSGVHSAVGRNATPPPGAAAAGGARPVTGPQGPAGRFQPGQGIKGAPIGGVTGSNMPAAPGRAPGRGRLAAAGAGARGGRPLNAAQRRAAGGQQPGKPRGSNKMMVIILVILGALIAGLAGVLIVLSGSGGGAS